MKMNQNAAKCNIFCQSTMRNDLDEVNSKNVCMKSTFSVMSGRQLPRLWSPERPAEDMPAKGVWISDGGCPIEGGLWKIENVLGSGAICMSVFLTSSELGPDCMVIQLASFFSFFFGFSLLTQQICYFLIYDFYFSSPFQHIWSDQPHVPVFRLLDSPLDTVICPQTVQECGKYPSELKLPSTSLALHGRMSCLLLSPKSECPKILVILLLDGNPITLVLIRKVLRQAFRWYQYF
jgi:hypothetical protein